MLALLLLIYLNHNVCHGRNIYISVTTGREALFSRISDSYLDDRNVWNIVWSCFATLFACSWVAVHPNVPSSKDSEVRIFVRRLSTMGYMLVVPELVILWAGRQYFAAKAYASKHQERGWTRTHAHFLIMGGFALHDADKSFLRVLDESTLEELYVKEEIVWPSITEPEIQDRSKADLFSKGVVLLQTAWFIIECLSRFATKLAVTELEVVTLAFAALNGITYWLWWHKPSDVRCPVPVYLKTGAESKVQRVQDARAQRDPEPTTTISSSNDIPTQPASGRLSFTRRRSQGGVTGRFRNTHFTQVEPDATLGVPSALGRCHQSAIEASMSLRLVCSSLVQCT